MSVSEAQDIIAISELVCKLARFAMPKFGGLKHPVRIGCEELSSILLNNDLEPPKARLVKNKKFFDPRSLVVEGTRARLITRFQHVEKYILNGYTLIIDDIASVYLPVANFCAKLKEQTGYQCYANLYVSYNSEEAYGAHVDDHHVLALQCSGLKLWDFVEEKRIGPDFRLFETKEGDGVFIPVGFRHNVRSSNCWSFHISIAIN